MEVQLTYFKSNGTFYSSGRYNTYKMEMFQIFDEVRQLLNSGKLPDLVDNAKFITLVNVPAHENNYPALIIPL